MCVVRWARSVRFALVTRLESTVRQLLHIDNNDKCCSSAADSGCRTLYLATRVPTGVKACECSVNLGKHGFIEHNCCVTAPLHHLCHNFRQSHPALCRRALCCDLSQRSGRRNCLAQCRMICAEPRHASNHFHTLSRACSQDDSKRLVLFPWLARDGSNCGGRKKIYMQCG